MGNSLLDFVMALVRDPGAAARYAADPAGALADAHLSGVTITDVQNLIPVVTDSLAMSTPDLGAVADAANVWTSGAAAAAFDAFDLPHPAPPAPVPTLQLNDASVDHSTVLPEPAPPQSAPEHLPVPVLADAVADHQPLDPVVQDWADDGGWQHSHDPQVPDHHPVDHPGFDLF